MESNNEMAGNCWKGKKMVENFQKWSVNNVFIFDFFKRFEMFYI